MQKICKNHSHLDVLLGHSLIRKLEAQEIEFVHSMFLYRVIGMSEHRWNHDPYRHDETAQKACSQRRGKVLVVRLTGYTTTWVCPKNLLGPLIFWKFGSSSASVPPNSQGHPGLQPKQRPRLRRSLREVLGIARAPRLPGFPGLPGFRLGLGLGRGRLHQVPHFGHQLRTGR